MRITVVVSREFDWISARFIPTMVKVGGVTKHRAVSKVPGAPRDRADILSHEGHGKAHGHTGRHGIKAQFVAQPVAGNDGVVVGHPCLPAKGIEGFKFRLSQRAGIVTAFGQLGFNPHFT